MLEKAMAKVSTNYLNLHGGQNAVALRTLTGMPVKEFNSQAQDDWAIIQNAD